MTQARYEVLKYLKTQLVGPVGGPTEELRDPPDQRYSAAVLYPREVRQVSAVGDDIGDGSGSSLGDAAVDDPVALAGQWMPSSVGISFYVVGGQTVSCRVSAAQYLEARANRRSVWRRQPIGKADGESHDLTWSREGQTKPLPVLGARGHLTLNARRLGEGYLVTVSLLNSLTNQAEGRPNAKDCLFQVELECRVATGRIAEYPRLEFLTADREEEELFLAYRSVRVFALGHGCAAGWEAEGTTAAVVVAEFVPHVEVLGLTASASSENPALALSFLADASRTPAEVGRQLSALLGDYEHWVEESERVDVPAGLHGARDRVLTRLREALARMRAGVDLLSDPSVAEAFRLANLAMLMQMHHSQAIARDRRARDSAVAEDIDYLSLTSYRWYPFQIGFLLLCLRSLAHEDSPEREIVDLLWFPTGGGKTEAYLLVAAFVIFLRRLREGDRGAGTTVITRYTLRLLTTQQFQRAAALACCAEMIRRGDEERLGSTPIGIGLWVGGETSPNTFREARALVDKILDGVNADDLLPIEQCPWCGTELLPSHHDDDRSAFGIEATNGSFRLFCPTKACPFHESLPISVVDEDMYEHPPTILIGTVDKFARLAWTEGGGAFFGLGKFKPPSLIIQDELHLISGPLGTTVGLYESAIQGLIDLAGARPKVIASTATIRRANDQAIALFGRTAALFPPSGLDSGDSFFAHVDDKHAGRLYVGVMSQNHTASTALVHLSAVLAQAPVELELVGAELDAYWTQVIYHNSLRELGKVVTYARDDIPARIEVIAAVEDRRRLLDDGQVVELTSNIPSRQIPAVLARMKARNDSPDSISLLLATNMIQVGIDVPRLGLMLVNGQPKTTSEYIQASSRVGRGETLGLVVTLLSPSKPRDRSHYESFRGYHLALYRHVEPTSVTPFALPARERALHAALVILVRHGAGLPHNDDAIRFRSDDSRVRRAVAALLDRVSAADPLERRATEEHLERLVAEWAGKAEQASRDASRLYYYTAGREHRRVLRQFGQAGDGWETLNSMRSVDRGASVDVVGALAGG